jgi:methyltransferase (TIGR00027 family)
MRRNQTSLTAAGIALARAIESEKSAEDRICYDPYARQFVPGWMYSLFGFFMRSGYAEWRGPGVAGFLVARERYIDDILQDFLEKGLQQLVILGAGYDSRSYRFDLPAHDVNAFEVDHPATQEDKKVRVREVFGTLPGHVTYVSVDFNTQKLEQRLPESGYDPRLKTLFVWQGVTMYLQPEAVDATLAFVRKYSSPGSAIIFDYIYRQVLEGIQKHEEISSMRRYRFMSGEALTFGIPEGLATTFLEKRGFREVKDVSAGDLRQAYFTGARAERKVAGGYGIILGMV